MTKVINYSLLDSSCVLVSGCIRFDGEWEKVLQVLSNCIENFEYANAYYNNKILSIDDLKKITNQDEIYDIKIIYPTEKQLSLAISTINDNRYEFDIKFKFWHHEINNLINLILKKIHVKFFYYESITEKMDFLSQMYYFCELHLYCHCEEILNNDEFMYIEHYSKKIKVDEDGIIINHPLDLIKFKSNLWHTYFDFETNDIHIQELSYESFKNDCMELNKKKKNNLIDNFLQNSFASYCFLIPMQYRILKKCHFKDKSIAIFMIFIPLLKILLAYLYIFVEYDDPDLYKFKSKMPTNGELKRKEFLKLSSLLASLNIESLC
jgi:hypothetical protein